MRPSNCRCKMKARFNLRFWILAYGHNKHIFCISQFLNILYLKPKEEREELRLCNNLDNLDIWAKWFQNIYYLKEESFNIVWVYYTTMKSRFSG